MHKTILLFFFLISIIATGINAQQLAMSDSEIISLKKEVKIKAEKTKTITSDFTQFKHLDFLSNDIKTYGKMIFKAPNLVKWQYTDPYKYSVIFKSDKLLINDGGKKSDVKIGSSKLFKRLNELIVSSVNGDMFDDEQFSITYTKSSDSYIILFDSKDKELRKYIKQFVLHFNKNDFSVNEVKMIEPSDDYTRIVFTNRKENLAIKDEVFTN